MTTATADKLEEKIVKMVSETGFVPIEAISKDASLRDDLGYDSLMEVELIMALEEEFGFSVEDEEAEKIKTVGDVLEHVKSKLKK